MLKRIYDEWRNCDPRTIEYLGGMIVIKPNKENNGWETGTGKIKRDLNLIEITFVDNNYNLIINIVDDVDEWNEQWFFLEFPKLWFEYG